MEHRTGFVVSRPNLVDVRRRTPYADVFGSTDEVTVAFCVETARFSSYGVISRVKFEHPAGLVVSRPNVVAVWTLDAGVLGSTDSRGGEASEVLGVGDEVLRAGGHVYQSVQGVVAFVRATWRRL